jgi:hypothetical protein
MNIHNVHLLTDVFGRFPTFHDAEVVSVSLDRIVGVGANLSSKIHVFEMTAEVGDNGRYVLKNHILVDFSFEKIWNLDLKGFNHQNALFGLTIAERKDAETQELDFEVTFEEAFGFSATFECESIKVNSVEPYVL